MTDSPEPPTPAEEPDLWKPTICDRPHRPTGADVDRAAALAPGAPPALSPEFDEAVRTLRAMNHPLALRLTNALADAKDHLATLTRERDEARDGAGTMPPDVKFNCGYVARSTEIDCPHCVRRARQADKRDAKIEALEWVLRLHTYDYDAFAKPINEELARLRAEQEKPSDA